MMRGVKMLLLSLLALLVPTLLFAGWLWSTTSGLGWLLNRFDHLLQVETVEGSLSGEFSLGGLDFTSDAANLSIDTLAINWQPSGLLTGNLVIDRLSLSGLQGRSVPNDQASEISGLHSPIDISIGQATGERISWNDRQIDKVSFAGLLRGQTLQITQLDVAAPRLALQASGKVNVGLRERGIVELEQQLTYQPPDAAPLSLHSRISGKWASFNIALDVAAPYETAVEGTVDKVLQDSRRADLLISLANADLPMAAQLASVSGVSGEIKLNSVGKAINTDLDLTLQYTRAARRASLSVLGSASVDQENLTLRHLRLSQAGTPVATLPATVTGQAGSPPAALPVVDPGLRISGTVSGYRAILAGSGTAPAASDTNFDLAAEWSDPTIWEVLGESAIASPNGNIAISGPLSNYRLAVDIDLAEKPGRSTDQGSALTGKLLGSGSGNAQQFDLTELALTGFVGTATGRARVGWQDSLSWSTELAVSRLRSEFFADNWPGLVNANLVSNGTQSSNGLSGRIKADNISGELREMPLRAALDLQFQNSQFELTSLNASLGSSSVTAQGQLGEQSNLSYTLVIPDLGLFADDTGGSIDASGTLLGNISTPRVIGKASASQFRFRHWQLAEFNSDFDISLASSDAPWTGSLALKDLSLDQQKIIEKSAVSLSGNALAHQLEIRNSIINEVQNDISVKARWDAGTWSGSVEQLQFKDGNNNDWAMSNPTDFSLSGQRQTVSKFCLRNRSSATAPPSLCAALGEAGDHQIAELDLQRIPGALFNSLLTKYGFNIDTDLDAELEARFSLRSEYRPSLFAAVHSNRGLLKYRMSAAPSDSVVVSKKARPLDRQLEYSNFHLVVDSIDSTTIIVAANLEEQGYLRGRLSIEESLFSERLSESGLSGVAIAALPSLSMLAASQTATVSMGGSLQADLNITGQVANPALDLNLAVTDGELYLPEAGVHLTKLGLNVNSQADSRASITGSAVSGSGEYLLDGQVNLADASEIDGQIMLVGSNVALVHTETLHADGDVSLTLQLQERNIDLSGEIAIARGSIGTSSRPGVISESGDVIILSDSPRSKPLTTTADITIDLGNDMQINASGLRGRLAGKPRITRSKAGLVTSTGSISIVDGKFAAYGQKLDISRGQASYAGGDIDNPALQVEATRSIRGIKAGISITGPAENPDVRLFSEPAMNDRDILSYLVFGKPINQLNSADGVRLLSIANSLRGGSSTSQLDLLSDRIASTFGLESVNLEFDISGESPSVGIRSQITSKLEVGYGYNFISSIRTILLRYKLTDHWSIQSNIDVESGADFKYQIEK